MEERERREGGVEVGEENEGKRKKQKQHRLMTSLREENDKAQLCVCVCVRARVCAVLTPLNGKNLDNAHRPLPAKLW